MRLSVVIPLGIVLVALSCATSRERWNDEEDPSAPKHKPVRAAQNNTPPPVSFVVPPSGDNTQVDDEEVPPSGLSTAAPRTQPKRAPREDVSDVPAETPTKPHEIPVIVENAAPQVYVRQGDPDRLRSETGAPLTGGDQYGAVAENPPAEKPEPVAPEPGKKPEETPPPSRPLETETKHQDETPAAASDSAFVDVQAPAKDGTKKRKTKKHPKKEQPAAIVSIAPDPGAGAGAETTVQEFPVRTPVTAPVHEDSAPVHSEVVEPEQETETAAAPTAVNDNSIPENNGQADHERSLRRDPHWIGISITGGVGGFLASETRPGYLHLPTLAYGGQITISPRFMGDFALDLGFWRTGQAAATSFDGITGTVSEIAARVMFLPRIGAGFFCGFGLGFVYTYTTASYSLSGATAGQAGSFAPGADGTVALGWRISYFEMRLDLRTLLSGGLRLDFLPTFSVGITF